MFTTFHVFQTFWFLFIVAFLPRKQLPNGISEATAVENKSWRLFLTIGRLLPMSLRPENGRRAFPKHRTNNEPN